MKGDVRIADDVQKDGYHRLCCAVLLSAVKAATAMESPRGKRYRALHAFHGGVPPIDAMRQAGLIAPTRSERPLWTQIMSDDIEADPVAFLSSETVYHQLAGCPADRFAALYVSR